MKTFFATKTFLFCLEIFCRAQVGPTNISTLITSVIIQRLKNLVAAFIITTFLSVGGGCQKSFFFSSKTCHNKKLGTFLVQLEAVNEVNIK